MMEELETTMILSCRPGPYDVWDYVSFSTQILYYSPSLGRLEWLRPQEDHLMYLERSDDGGITFYPHRDPTVIGARHFFMGFLYQIAREDAGKRIFLRLRFPECAHLYDPSYPEDGQHLGGCISNPAFFDVRTAPPAPAPVSWKILIIGAVVAFLALGRRMVNYHPLKRVASGVELTPQLWAGPRQPLLWRPAPKLVCLG